MAFSDLALDAQAMVLSNHSYLLKWFVWLLLIFLSCYYLFFLRKEHKETSYFTIGILRVFTSILSFVFLVTTPLTILLMSPEYDFYDFYMIPMSFYSIVLSLMFVFWVIDFFRYAPQVFLQLAGMDMDDPTVSRIAKYIENNKFMRFGRNGKR